jgi:anti-anti-sigma factor
MPQASAVRSSTVVLEYAAPQFVCSWKLGDSGAAWVRVAGELDLVTSPQFRQRMGEARRAAPVVVLDLRELCFIDGSGVHVILDAADDCGLSGGRLLIVRGSAQVERVLALTEISKQVVIFDLAPGEPEPGLSHALSMAAVA